MPRALAFLLAWVPYAVLVRTLWWVCDDAYISFRYAKHWAEGAGIRFNPGEHVPPEGYSNFLLVALAAGVEALGLRPALWIPLVSVAAGSWLLWSVQRAALRLGTAPGSAFLATLVLATCTPFAAWSTGGLETMLFAALLFAAFDRLVLRDDLTTRSASLAGVLLVGLALTRPEGLAWAVVVLVLGAGARRARTGVLPVAPLGTALAVLAVGAGAHLLWRHGYHGGWSASTVGAKVAFTGPRLARGVDYVVAQCLATPVLFAALPVLVVALRAERRARALPVALMPLGVAAVAALVSGDFMAFGRFLVPGLAFGALGLAWVFDDLGRRAAPPVAGALMVLGVLPAFDLHVVPASLRERFHFRLADDYKSEHAQWRDMCANTERWALRGRALDAVCAPGDSVVLSGIGITGYASDLFVHDRHGFVSPEVAAADRPDDLPLRTPGHDAPVDRRFFLGAGPAPTVLRARVWEGASLEDVQGRARTWGADLQRQRLAGRYVLDVHALPGGAHRMLALWHLRSAHPDTAAADGRVAGLLAGRRPAELAIEPPSRVELGLAPW